MRSSWPTTNEPDALAPDVVHVWAVPLDGGQPPNETLLSADERRRAELFRRPELRRRFVSARVGLRTVLSRYLGVGPADVGLAFEPAGKPRLAMRDDAADRLRFNLSHSGELALVAVADRCEVGGRRRAAPHVAPAGGDRRAILQRARTRGHPVGRSRVTFTHLLALLDRQGGGAQGDRTWPGPSARRL